jgi:PKHD-type hydroxylase
MVKEKEGTLRVGTPLGLLSNNEVSDDPRNWPDPYQHQTLAGAIFTSEECSTIVRTGLGLARTRAAVKINGEDQRRLRTRHARIGWIVSSETTHWIFQAIAAAVAEANSTRWHYDLQPIERLQFTEYGFGGHYGWHVDVGVGVNITRKLSFSVQLSQPSIYIGGKLQFLRGRFKRAASAELGSITIFPSFMQHRVTPLLFGKRYSLVGWVHGSEPLK